MSFINRPFCFFLFLFILNINSSFCQSLYGGEIYIENISGLGYKATVALSIDNSINANNKPYVLLDWGDGTALDTLRNTTISCGNIAYTKSYTSSTVHTYTSSVNYILTCTEGHFIGSISNMPSSINQSLTLNYNLNLSPLSGSNNSPISSSCLTNTFSASQNTFNQNASDNNVDSLAYSLYSPSYPGYSNSNFTINGNTGLITHINNNNGIFLIPVKIEEWRKVSNANYLVGVSYRYHSLIYNMSVGFNENNIMNYIKIYPNPVISIINIDDEQNELHNSNIEIKNYLGQTLYSNVFTSQIDVSGFSAGMYFLTIKSGNTSKTVKVIKQ